MNIKRYDMELPDLEQEGKMEPRTEGEYVRFEDHEKAMEEAQNTINQLVSNTMAFLPTLAEVAAERDRLNEELDYLRKVGQASL